MKIRKITNFITSYYHKSKRVWHLLKRPTMTEFKLVSKVTAIGLLVIGAIGFAISVTMKLAF